MASEKTRIGIIGLGLIGGSIARALKRNGDKYSITAWDQHEDSLQKALSEGVIDHGVSLLGEGFKDSEIIFLCVPVYSMKDILIHLVPGLPHNCILTDVGSTKGDVLNIITELDLNRLFIGGHPLAGSEKSGYSASKANLFENVYYCLTPVENSDRNTMERLETLVKDMGAIPIEISPEEHDKVTAAISHVPHVVAALLVNLVGKLDNSQNTMKTIAAGGFKDITRIASSSPDLWTGICLSNKEKVLDTLSVLKDGLQRFENDLKVGNKSDIQAFFHSAQSLRSTFSERKSLIQKTFDIVVDVDDKPGIIAVIASALANENINIKNIGILNNRESEEGALQIQFENEESRRRGMETLSQLGYKNLTR